MEWATAVLLSTNKPIAQRTTTERPLFEWIAGYINGN
jgi:hypothetical protein